MLTDGNAVVEDPRPRVTLELELDEAQATLSALALLDLQLDAQPPGLRDHDRQDRARRAFTRLATAMADATSEPRIAELVDLVLSDRSDPASRVNLPGPRVGSGR